MMAMMLSQFPLFFTIGFLGTLMLNIYYSGLPFKTLVQSAGWYELIISSALMPFSVYLGVIIIALTWKISLPILGVLLLFVYLSRP
jgi:hypothetical protein